MNILCAESVLEAKALFSPLGNVTLCPDDQIQTASLAGIHALIVRSKTHVTPELLAGTDITFVGTATAGTEHVDRAYLAENNIVFADAAGANAQSVAEYIVFALSYLEVPAQQTLGIIGYGHVGKALAKVAQALGFTVIAHDPLLAEQTDLVTLEKLLTEADIVSLHANLTHKGPHASYHLLNAARLAQLKPGALLINTARGELIDTEALLDVMDKNALKAIIDVWENEPHYALPLAQKATIATPHIAGYSYEARLAGSYAVYEKLCAFGKAQVQTPPWSLGTHLVRYENGLGSLLKQVYDIEKENNNFIALASVADDQDRAEGFKKLRREHPRRLSFMRYRLSNSADVTDFALLRKLQALGLQC